MCMRAAAAAARWREHTYAQCCVQCWKRKYENPTSKSVFRFMAWHTPHMYNAHTHTHIYKYIRSQAHMHRSKALTLICSCRCIRAWHCRRCYHIRVQKLVATLALRKRRSFFHNKPLAVFRLCVHFKFSSEFNQSKHAFVFQFFCLIFMRTWF